MMWKFFYPLRYFQLVNREKRVLDIFPTLILAVLIWCPFYFFDNASFFRPNGFLDKVLSLAGALTGFYIAALVAAATFVHSDLDRPIQYGAVYFKERDAEGAKSLVALTRREFVCTIFGYLSFSALAISVASAVAVGLSTAKFPSGLLAYKQCIRLIVAFIYSLSISHLIVVTTLGLYYLMDRLYRHDQIITSKKPDI